MWHIFYCSCLPYLLFNNSQKENTSSNHDSLHLIYLLLIMFRSVIAIAMLTSTCTDCLTRHMDFTQHDILTVFW